VDANVWDERYAGDDLVWSAEPNRFLVAEVEQLPAGRALDLACGEGRNAVWLAERGWDVTGVDFSNVGLDKARRLAALRDVSVRWELADVTEYASTPESFGLVIVMYLHLPEATRRVAFRRAAAAVAAGGTLLVVGHDVTNPTEGWGGPRDPAVLYGPDDVVADLVGLETVKAERVRRPVPTDDGEKIAIDVLVRARRRTTRFATPG
jgi:SAM-dependent methyltransferase